MIFLFEKFAYSPEYLKNVLPSKLPGSFVGHNGILDGVGYIYNASLTKGDGDTTEPSDKIVFVLPKVFMDEGGTKAFGQIIRKNENFVLSLENEFFPKEFLSKLSMWVCSSISQYRLSNPADKFVKAPNAMTFGSEKQAPTLIDVMNAMKRFYDENRNLVVFTAKNKHCGNNRIDWRRTVSRTQPFVQGNAPIYMDLENKKKVFDLDDRLLVLYFSAMNYIEETFGFKMPRSDFYTPMRVNEFRRLLGHRGIMEMRRIRHKYFADKFLKLFNIVKAFFEWGGSFSANHFESEYLLTSKYNNVFEAMIDKLVGDPEFQKLKKNEDGKIIDHLYKEESLVFASKESFGNENDLIWHIGDSKYYKEKTDFGDYSIAKQYSYARNVMQDFFNPDFIASGKECGSGEHRGVRYRDNLTEGYSVTPNFFIRGEIPEYGDNPIQFKEEYFRKNATDELIKFARKGNDADEVAQRELKNELWNKRNRHFENRLFDRDTLLLQAYDVNFLYVLKAYTSRNSSLSDDFKRNARKKFRENFLALLKEKYYFWALYLPNWENDDYKDRLEKFVNDNFRWLVGRVFQPKDTPHCLILALEREIVDNPRRGPNANKEFDKLRQIIVAEHCEIFSLLPQDIWNNGVSQRWDDDDFRDNDNLDDLNNY